MKTPITEKIAEISRQAASADPAHDFNHCLRVLSNALRISETEGGDREVLAAAAFLHDIANLPKSHPESHLSSERSAERSVTLCRELGFSEPRLVLLRDAVLCHSFSRGLTPATLEGKIFQDADRLDALGAIGIARTFAVAGATSSALYDAGDPFLERGRKPNDKKNALDHFEMKLFRLIDRMQTPTGRKLAEERIGRMKRFVADLKEEIGSAHRPDHHPNHHR